MVAGRFIQMKRLGWLGCALVAFPCVAQPRTAFAPEAAPPVVSTGAAYQRVDPATSRPQFFAARNVALDKLEQDISRQQLTSKLTVGEMVQRCHGQEIMRNELNHAEVLGGPRWLDDDTCQVQMQISGTQISFALQQMAQRADAPLSPKAVADITTSWRRRDFTATGSATVFARVLAARPRAGNAAWQTVSDADRTRALTNARADALNRVLVSIRPIPLYHGLTLADVLANREMEAAVSDWIVNQPVVAVEYRADLQVVLTLAVEPDVLSDVLRRELNRHPAIAQPSHEQDWVPLRMALEERMDSAVGRAPVGSAVEPAVIAPPQAMPPRQAVRLPIGTPRWFRDKIVLRAEKAAFPSKLKAARAAESAARQTFSEKLNALPLTSTETVGQAAARDPRIADAVARAVDGARIERTDYYHGPNVEVEMSLELRELWERIRVLP